jgi:membrane protease YdiL (CAAX protease family)
MASLKTVRKQIEMTPQKIFINERGRVRSGWRLLIFLILFLLASLAVDALFIPLLGSHDAARQFFRSVWGNVIGRALVIVIATFVGWLCGRVLEDLPFRALGWALHRGWLRDFVLGSLLGCGSLLLAILLATVFGGYTFAFASSDVLPAALKMLVLAAGFWIIAGAAEEVVLRGYPLQTLLRSLPAWIPLVLTAILFAWGHLQNPNVVPGFTFANTMLAGIWLAVAYLRTRSLWLPVGIHWAWNWTLGTLLGLPVSGTNMLTSVALIPTTDRGPAWLTGGAYGIEGGAACTVALLISTVFIWRTRFLRADDEMRRLTDEEIPNPRMMKTPATLEAFAGAPQGTTNDDLSLL